MEEKKASITERAETSKAGEVRVLARQLGEETPVEGLTEETIVKLVEVDLDIGEETEKEISRETVVLTPKARQKAAAAATTAKPQLRSVAMVLGKASTSQQKPAVQKTAQPAKPAKKILQARKPPA